MVPLLEIHNFLVETQPNDICLSIQHLVINPNKIYALVSSSGNGKSILLGFMAGHPPVSWYKTNRISSISIVKYFGDAVSYSSYSSPIRYKREIDKLVGSSIVYLPQNFPDEKSSCVKTHDAMAHVLASIIPGISLRNARNEIAKAFSAKDMGVEDTLDKQLKALSGGERRRVELAARLHGLTLKKSPGHKDVLILLDEPTSGIDVLKEQRFFSYLSKLVHGNIYADLSIAAVVATHALSYIKPYQSDTISGYFDGVILLDRDRQTGDPVCRVVYHGPVNSVFDHFNVVSGEWADVLSILDNTPSAVLEQKFDRRYQNDAGIVTTIGT